MTLLAIIAGIASCTLLIVQLGSLYVAFRRLNSPIHSSILKKTPHITLIRPLCGLDNFAEELLLSCFKQDYPCYDILFCVASAQDPVIPYVNHLIDCHPERSAKLLIGNDLITKNPKLNNMEKAWQSTSAQWIAMADSNLLLPPDYLRSLILSFDEQDTGLVSSPAIGIRPANLWGAVEAALLNTHQARWQFLSDAIGLGFAQGKTLFWHRDVLDRRGGLSALGHELAEDVASTKLVRDAGLKVHLTPRPFAQPIGERTLRAVWDRQLRWARIRRLGFFWLFIPEILLGSVPVMASLMYLAHLQMIPWILPPAVFILWYGAEWMVAKLLHWPHSARDVCAMIIRDMLLPLLWLWCWAGRSFVWHGNAMNSPASVNVKEHKEMEH